MAIINVHIVGDERVESSTEIIVERWFFSRYQGQSGEWVKITPPSSVRTVEDAQIWLATQQIQRGVGHRYRISMRTTVIITGSVSECDI